MVREVRLSWSEGGPLYVPDFDPARESDDENDSDVWSDAPGLADEAFNDDEDSELDDEPTDSLSRRAGANIGDGIPAVHRDRGRHRRHLAGADWLNDPPETRDRRNTA